MFKKIKEFFTGKSAVTEAPALVAEYKVETPVAEVAVVETTPVVEDKPAKVKKPAAKKAPAAKKPRTPKAPK